MSKENEKFLSLYKTYEGLLRSRSIDYRVIEEEQINQGNGRMTIMRQMRNYLSHAEDPGFITISPACIKVLETMVKEEQMRGDIVKNHLITPSKGSVKEGTPLSAVVLKMVKLRKNELPVYDDQKRLRGMVLLENMASVLDKLGNILLDEKSCGPYGDVLTIVRPEIPTSIKSNSEIICCTKDGTVNTQYLGYLDI